SSDMTPFAVKTPVLSDEMFADIRNRPQVLEGVNADGDRVWIPFPSDAFELGLTESIDASEIDAILEEQGLIGGDTGVSLVGHTLFHRTATLTADDFQRRQAKH